MVLTIVDPSVRGVKMVYEEGNRYSKKKEFLLEPNLMIEPNGYGPEIIMSSNVHERKLSVRYYNVMRLVAEN